MLVWRFTLLLIISAYECADVLEKFKNEHFATPHYLENLEELPNIAVLDDAQHRGHKWYDDKEDDDSKTDSDVDSKEDVSSSLTSGTDTDSTSKSSEASSMETSERRLHERAYRACTPCKQDMIKQFKNLGIKWICGAYQRAWRTFKSECMMRYRNCQDGTMFVKIYDHRCTNDTIHGRHWFYVYRV